uniref:F-box domain-containing protein n=1 Tax=Oryza punctata TaxID=4537 RepID=A0A0E0M316_ORYPU
MKGWPCQQDDSSQYDKGIRSGLDLPEDIFRYIHALMPFRDAARAACVSRAFLQSWRCYPYLIFSKEVLGLEETAFREAEITRDLISKVDHILQSHSGIGVKKLKLDFVSTTNVDASYLDSWLHKAVTPRIEELTLILPTDSNAEYSFPCSLLSDGNANSIRNLVLSFCAIRYTVDLGCLRTLTMLDLCSVRITGSELECLLSNSLALEWLTMLDCKEIVQLKIPCLLKRLHSLRVHGCKMLKVIESYAPNLSTFRFSGNVVRMLGLLQLKTLRIVCLRQCNILSYARTKLLSVVPNVEELRISSRAENVSTPIVPGKFLCLKRLHISLGGIAFSPTYDYLSLVSFLDASPSLETFFLIISQDRMEHASVVGGSAQLRQMPEHRHANLKEFKITGFCSAKSLVELTCHILETTSSLKRVKLNTSYGYDRCYASGECYPYRTEQQIVEARNAVLAVKTYIVGKVPPTVKFDLVQLCSRCRALVQ